MKPKQYQLFSFIRNRLVHFGKAPTFSEMKEFMDVTSNQTIGDWLSILERDGYISRSKGELRGISITKKGNSGFDENIQVQDPDSVKKSFTPFSNSVSTTAGIFNASYDETIIIDAGNIMPKWKGGEKNGSS